ncbi:methyltransferase domain-containing protein [Granulicella sibirica]|uniref:methyltransferase domain-containing protein n=1 Tax=Granulicella sibirica TaxID=2479048 RepID=UPI001F4FF02A|nr:methyltransferase domain-containing protein [Granulicella sibirica]
MEDKRGIEIGGPTDLFRGWRTPSRCHWAFAPLPIYDRVGSLDNCNFSDRTAWGEHQQSYRFSSSRAPGKVIIAEGSNLASVSAGTYDFVLSSHNLEHFANPIKALLEWKRITRSQGALILVLPHYKSTFDHLRKTTSVEHMFDDFRNDVAEDDTTHLEEVVRLHDITMDGFLKSGSREEFRIRCENNFSNRMMHHHVFDERNSTELLTRVGLEVIAVELSLPYHMIILARWRE